jgi:hypothetical protein
MKAIIRSLLIAQLIAWHGLSSNAGAVNPPPDGAYPGGNTAEGQNALLNLTSGTYNTAVGFSSLKSNTTGNVNTAIGANALSLNTTGINNTANGVNALYNNTVGTRNTANGGYALFSNTTGYANTASGAFALWSNTTGFANTAIGGSALSLNTTGVSNTANGYFALYNNATGSGNTASGVWALLSNTIGGGNTASGANALWSNTTGNGNTAIGAGALAFNTTGSANIAIGPSALAVNSTGSSNIAIGGGSLAHPNADFNIAIGAYAGYEITGPNNIDIGANVLGVAGESNTIRIGNTDITDTFIGGISGTTVASGAAVLVDSSGHLGTVTSSKRFKEEIRPMNKTSEAIFSLEPVTFRYKKEIDPARTQQFGLVAEDVEKVNPDLVVRDQNGKVNSVRYEQVNAMLLNEFLKEHRKVREQEATITLLKKEMAAVVARLKEQDAKIQRVNDRFEFGRSLPQVTRNDQ